MHLMKSTAALLILTCLAACSSLILKPADFSWGMEAFPAPVVDNKGFIEVPRFSFTLKVKSLFFEEFADSNNFAGKELRIIGDKSGHTFITGKNFKNVYIFMRVEGGMKLENKILIAEKGLGSPNFNDRSPNVELLDGNNKYLLNFKGIVR